MRLENKTAIVTGAGRNIGEAIARSYANEGAQVVVVDLMGERATAVADAINAAHPDSALAVECDVTSSEAVQAMVANVIKRWGSVDILVNNVGVVDRTNILELPEPEWHRVIATTLTSVFLVTKYVAIRMVERGHGGRIINIASTSGHRGRDGATAYPAAKGGVLNLTRTLAVQLGPNNIRVNSITPNRVLTEAEPGAPTRSTQVNNLVGRQGTPQDLANVAVFMASDDADFIAGADILVDGGLLAL
jgi:NAD(P)-dependent dehydrogenase (short-subunit alcohol dehydrogenase family)